MRVWILSISNTISFPGMNYGCWLRAQGSLLHDRLARGIEEAWSVLSGGAEIVAVVGQDWLSGHDRTWYNKAPEATLQQGGFGDMWARLHRTGPSMLSPLSRLFLVPASGMAAHRAHP